MAQGSIDTLRESTLTSLPSCEKCGVHLTARPPVILFRHYRAQDAVQVAEAIWRCSGYQVKQQRGPNLAHFPDGRRAELRGQNWGLCDKHSPFAPSQKTQTNPAIAAPPSFKDVVL